MDFSEFPKQIENNLSLFYTLKKLNKNVNITDSPNETIISINASDKEIAEMRYESTKKELNIYLTLKKGTIQEKDISLKHFQKTQKEALGLPAEPKIKLLSRVLSNMELEPKKEIYYSCLKNKDFLYSKTRQKDLGFIIKELKGNTWHIPSFLLLWEEPASPHYVKGVFYSPKKELFNKLLDKFQGTLKKDGLLFQIRESDINKAKEKVLYLWN